MFSFSKNSCFFLALFYLSIIFSKDSFWPRVTLKPGTNSDCLLFCSLLNAPKGALGSPSGQVLYFSLTAVLTSNFLFLIYYRSFSLVERS